MSPKLTRDERVRERLLDFWQPGDGFGLPIGCVATTYTFDGAFFEEECLARFVDLESNPREDSKAYVIEREEKLADVFSCVLVDQAHVTPYRSLRWNLLPVRVPGGGVMHAKVSLLVWEHHVRCLISSANLTEPGYRSNYEHLAVLDFEDDSAIPITPLAAVIHFLERLRSMAPQQRDSVAEGPQARLDKFLRDTWDRVRSWRHAKDWPRGAERTEFCPVWPNGPTLFEQLTKLFPAQTGPQEVWVLSPFFDADEGAARLVRSLVGLMAARGTRVLHFCAPGRKLHEEDKTVELDLPASLAKSVEGRTRHHFYMVNPRDEEGEFRRLHAKSLWLEREDRVLYSVGSSNFTHAGTGVAKRSCNIEANLAYVLPPAAARFRRHCDSAYPPLDELDSSEQQIEFTHGVAEDSAGSSDVHALPDAFGLALFRPGSERGVLELAISGSPPDGFVVSAEKGRALLTDAEWRAEGSSRSVEIDWDRDRPPSHVIVSWKDGGEGLRAIWVVNVTDASLLPPPEELRTLRLDELLAILTSARPLHAMIPGILRKRENQNGSRRSDLETDPHRKVEGLARNFLIRRMRRIAGALEGLRERLERPTHHLEALRWRLHGPVGPVALARKLMAEEKQATAFMLAEVALTVHRTDWSRVEGVLGQPTVRKEVRTVLRELAEMAKGEEVPQNLAAYVQSAFKEVMR